MSFKYFKDSTDLTFLIKSIVDAVKAMFPTKTSDLTNDSGYLTEHQSLAGCVPTTRKVAGHPLSADVSLTKDDVGLDAVDNTADADKSVLYAATAGAATDATARKSASDAASAAAAADTKAGDAATAAANAQSTADSAKTAAGTAQTTADNANTAAGKAQTAADNAASAASAAQNTADGKCSKSSVAVTINTGDWSNNACTKSVAGVTANNDVLMAWAPSTWDVCKAAGIRVTAQAAGSLSFACDTAPTAAATVNVMILN